MLKIRYLNEHDVKTVAQMRLDHWQTVYRGMVDDDYLDGLTLEKLIAEVGLYVNVVDELLEIFSDRFEEDKENVDNIVETLKRLQVHAVIAENESQEILGFCTFGYRWIKSGDIYNFNDYDYIIHEIYVTQALRKRGIGRKLIGFVFKEAWKHGQKKVLLKVHAQNENAIDFYKKIGGYVLGKSEVELGDKTYPQVVIGFQLECRTFRTYGF